MNMKKNPMPLFLPTLTIVIAFGLLATGCGLNRADEGTVTVPPAAELEQEARIDENLVQIADLEAELAEARATAAEAARVAAAAAARPILVTVPMSTVLEIDLLNDLSSETSLPGDAVDATVVQDVIVDGRVAIAAGSEIRGVVTEVVASRKFGGQARLLLDFDALIDANGETPIFAKLELAGQRQKKKDAATIGGAAAGGAILGRILNDNDRSEGTAVGAVLGGAIGTIVAANNQADPVILPAGSALAVTLDAPLTVELAR